MMRRTSGGTALVAVSIALMAGCSTVSTPMPTAGTVGATARQTAPKVAAIIPGEIIVKFKTTSRSGDTMSKYGLTRKRGLSGINAMLTKTSADVLTTVAELQADPNVQYASANYVETTLEIAAPNDPDYAKQYAPQITHAPEGWVIAKGDPNTLLAIVDTGIDSKHPDLAAKIGTNYNAIDQSNNANDGHGHGTHCAGIAAALTNNGVGMAGIAPNNRIFSVKVLSDSGQGTTADVCSGMTKAADMGAKVISMSLGGSGGQQVKQDAVNYCLSKDALIVAAMGNDGGNVKTYPGACDGVMAVGSTDAADKRSSFSNFGTWISVTAPGSKIWSTLPTGGSAMGTGYGIASGTSMATPAVAGLAILVRSQFPLLTAKQTKAKIEASVDDLGAPGFDNEFGHGRINVLKALT
ncbi:MAG: peptidase S8, partial [Candidatus Sericytochromatia bacterium]|nr:peptidase S8 [Candidatus Sericytochromatia bacterium]